MPASESPARGADFEQTHWSIVLAAQGAEDSSLAQSALGKLCAAYWYPLYAFVRRTGKSAHDAQDLTQEFFARLLEKNWLADVDRDKGRFRSFLLTAMKHFLANEWDKTQAAKRGGGAPHLSLDAEDAEGRYTHEPADNATADKLYDRRWALAVLDAVLVKLEQEYASAGKAELYQALKPMITGGKSPYAEIAARFGIGEGTVKVSVHRLRERYRDLIRAEIAETVATAGEIDDELRHLLAALGA
jgi:RNA polymerase sigma-70 factor (ECF subfamily)